MKQILEKQEWQVKNMAIITTQSTTINDPSTPSGKADLSVKYIKNLIITSIPIK